MKLFTYIENNYQRKIFRFELRSPICKGTCMMQGTLTQTHFHNLTEIWPVLLKISTCRGGSRIWSGGGPDRDRPKLPMVHSSVVWAKQALLSVGSGARLRAPEALGYFITKCAFSPFWGTFLHYFWNNKILIFLDKLPWQTFLYTGIQILDQMDMYLFLMYYFLLKYQSIMHQNHNKCSW